MPLEIHELIVRATIVKAENRQSSAEQNFMPQNGPNIDQDNLITKDAVQQVMDIIKRQKER